MASIIGSNLAGSTITYNGVQFGGADAAFKSAPPEYSLNGTFVYDDAGRAVIGVDYTLIVRAYFYESSEAALGANVEAVRERLSSPGKELKIEGVGLGFDTISDDIKWGPKPVSFAWTSRGQLAWECVWTIQFRVSECASQSGSPLTWVAWNYETTWQNDFEGFCARTTSGYVEIAGRRTAANPNAVNAIADQVRESITILTPQFFKRTNNVWRESADKTRLDFVVVDEQLPGDPYPAGVTLAKGFCDFDTTGPGFAKAKVSIGMSLRTSPEVAPGLAGVLFMQAMLAKQAAMQQRLNADGRKGSVIPQGFSIRNEKWDESRVTNCSATWMLVKCLSAMLNATGIWEPLIPGDYNQWRTSVENLWKNRGNAGLAGQSRDDVIIDVCSGVTSKTFGNSPSNPPSASINGQFSFTCPEIPPDGGWIGYDLRVTLAREDAQTEHRKALSYSQGTLPSMPPDSSGSDGYPMSLGSPGYSQSLSQQHVVEWHGYPSQLVLMQFKGMRVKHQPAMPVITTVGGHPVVLVRQSPGVPRVVFDVFECPVWYVDGWRLYRLRGPVDVIISQGSKDSCARPNVSSAY